MRRKGGCRQNTKTKGPAPKAQKRAWPLIDQEWSCTGPKAAGWMCQSLRGTMKYHSHNGEHPVCEGGFRHLKALSTESPERIIGLTLGRGIRRYGPDPVIVYQQGKHKQTKVINRSHKLDY